MSDQHMPINRGAAVPGVGGTVPGIFFSYKAYHIHCSVSQLPKIGMIFIHSKSSFFLNKITDDLPNVKVNTVQTS